MHETTITVLSGLNKLFRFIGMEKERKTSYKHNQNNMTQNQPVQFNGRIE